MVDSLEEIWDNLLSRQPERILEAFLLLSNQEKHAVLVHLKRMSTEPDWNKEQKISAQIAIESLHFVVID